MLAGYTPIMVSEPEPVVAPYNRCASCGASGGDTASAFTVFLGVTSFGDEPIEGSGSCRKCADRGGWVEKWRKDRKCRWVVVM